MSKNKIFFIIPIALGLLVLSLSINVSCQFQTTTSTYIDSFAMVDVPAINNFPMGWTEVADPVHIVPYISPFKIGKYEVTRELLFTVGNWAKENNYIFKGEVTGDPYKIISIKTEPNISLKYEPVEIFLIDALVWCNAYSEKEGLPPCYKLGGKILSNYYDVSNDNNIVWDRSADGYRLPTETEWEAAARYIDGINWLPGDYASGAAANYLNREETEKFVSQWGWYRPSDAGKKLPNHLGIYDMSGNIGEMCWDYFLPYSTLSPYTDTNPVVDLIESGERGYRVSRGGSPILEFYQNYWTFQTSVRNREYSMEKCGFRVVRRAK